MKLKTVCGSDCVNCPINLCTTCKENLKNVSGKCEPCPEIDQYVDSSGECQSCSENCSVCSSLSNCSICLPGYFLNKENSKCLACQENCTACPSLEICNTCGPGYTLQVKSNTCEQIITETGQQIGSSKPVKTIVIPNPLGSQTSMLENHTIQFSNLKNQIKNCLVYKSADKCFFCRPGFYIKEDLCSPCSSNCLKCSLSQLCTKCEDGFEKIKVNTNEIICQALKVSK